MFGKEENIANKLETMVAFTLVCAADSLGLKIYNTCCKSMRVHFAVCRVSSRKEVICSTYPAVEKIGCLLDTHVKLSALGQVNWSDTAVTNLNDLR